MKTPTRIAAMLLIASTAFTHTPTFAAVVRVQTYYHQQLTTATGTNCVNVGTEEEPQCVAPEFLTATNRVDFTRGGANTVSEYRINTGDYQRTRKTLDGHQRADSYEAFYQ